MSLDAVKDWSTNATLNTTLGPSLTLDGTVMKPSDVDDAFRQLMAQVAAQFGRINFKGADIASATTTNLAGATGNFVDITGTTTITGLGTVAAGQVFFLRFTGALTFAHNATSLVLPGAANITTANGDVACMLSLGSGNWKCAGYMRAGGGTIGTFNPPSNDGAALGTTALNWSDLFLASGGVINWDNGDVTITHAANFLAFAGASSGYTFSASIFPAANDGSGLGAGSNSWSDLFLASGGVINWNNGDVTVTHAANTLAFAGASSGYTFDALVTPSANDAAALGTTLLNFSDLFLAAGGVINWNSDVNIAHSTNTLTFSGAATGYVFDSTITATNITYSGQLTLLAGTAPTAEGAIQWNTTTNAILVGNSAATKTFRANSWETISETSISAAASWAATGLSAFRKLRITGFAIPASDATSLFLRTDSNNGASYDAGASDYNWQYSLVNAAILSGADFRCNR